MENTLAIALFIVFLIVNAVLFFKISRMKCKIMPLTLTDENGNAYTVETPGKIKIKVEVELKR